MASAGLHALGSAVEISTDDISWDAIAEIVDATPPDWMVVEAKATNLDSPESMDESKPGIGKSGKGTLTLNFTPTQLTTFLGYFRTIVYWRFSFPLDEGETTPARIGPITGFWTGIKPGKMDPEDTNILQFVVEFARSSGKPAFNAGS